MTTKYKLGDLIKQSFDKNTDFNFTEDDVRGISTQKKMIDTKADMNGVSTKNYLLVKPKYFAYVADTSRRGDKISLCYNNTEKTFICSSISTCFYVDKTDLLDSNFLFMYFNRPEFDRYARYNSWGSARENFNWDDFCRTEIELPPLKTQKKYVEIYISMTKKIQVHDKISDLLRQFLEKTATNLIKANECESISKYIEQSTLQNTKSEFDYENIMGISQNKCFIKTTADGSGNDIRKYYIVGEKDLAYSPRNGVAVALNETTNKFIISFNNTCFHIAENYKEVLLPEYLFMFFLRSEWDRHVAFDSWGSTETLYQFSELKNTMIPLLPISQQEKYAKLVEIWEKQNLIEEQIEKINSDLCSVLIQISIEESKKYE